jgi:DNA-binding beta-propeller fold protein YncE
MKRTTLAALTFTIAVAVPAVAAEYKVSNRIKLPDGGWDYIVSDPEHDRIIRTRTDGADLIDVKTGKVSTLKNNGNGHMIVPVPGTNLGVIPLRQPAMMVRIMDVAADKVVADVPGGDAPDGAVYDPFSKHVFVANHNGGTVTEVDPVAGKALAQIEVGKEGKLEFPASDGKGRVFVNIEEPGILGVIDVKAQKLTGKWKMSGCEDASGLAYTGPKTNLLIASCGNQVAKVVSAADGKEVASIPIGKGPDAVIYDDQRQLAFIPVGRDGLLEVISVADAAKVALVQHVQTQTLARTGALDPKSGSIYLMTATIDTAAGPGPAGRPVPKAGSFEMLVVSP